MGTDKARCGTVLHVSLMISKALAVMAYPFMPFSSESIWKQLCMDSTIEETGWKAIEMPLNEGRELQKPSPQFAKVEASSVSEFQKYAALNLKIGKVMDEFSQKAQLLNQMNISSCETAQALVGGIWLMWWLPPDRCCSTMVTTAFSTLSPRKPMWSPCAAGWAWSSPDRWCCPSAFAAT